MNTRNPSVTTQPVLRRLATGFVATVLLPSAATVARADVLSDWNATAEKVFVATGASPGIHYAMVHVAIYDAVNAIDGGHQPYAIVPASSAHGASPEAAAASAAYWVLRTQFPTQASLLDAAYGASLAAIPDGPAETAGVAIGAEVAAGIVALRANDGRNVSVPCDFGSEVGDYQRTPPGYLDPIQPWLARVTPFAMTSPDQFRPAGPLALTSEAYAIDYAEVLRMGSLFGSERTEAQTETARFHFEGPTTFWSRNFRGFISGRGLSIADAARLYAMLFIGFGDATIACWDAKYHYSFWRPVTAIQYGDWDGNPATAGVPGWMPLGFTPPHPEYPSAHTCISGTLVEVLRQFFGTPRVSLTFSSTVANTLEHHYDDGKDLVQEVINARVWGGFHFRSANLVGARMGRKLGHWIGTQYFQPVSRHPTRN